MPFPFMRRVQSTASAAPTSTFFGSHPRRAHVPPKGLESTIATCHPASRQCEATVEAADPVPMAITSNFLVIVPSRHFVFVRARALGHYGIGRIRDHTTGIDRTPRGESSVRRLPTVLGMATRPEGLLEVRQECPCALDRESGRSRAEALRR